MKFFIRIVIAFVTIQGAGFYSFAQEQIPTDVSTGDPTTTGYHDIEPREGLNRFATRLTLGDYRLRMDEAEESWRNLYVAFAVDVRFERECSGSQRSVICTFYHSSLSLSGNLFWTPDDGSARPDADRFRVILIPIEYVSGNFGKQGPDLELSATGATWVTFGSRTDYVRDLGLRLENYVLSSLNVSYNYSTEGMPLSENVAFRFIGSIRILGGFGVVGVTDHEYSDILGAAAETTFGLAVDLKHGTLSFTDSHRISADRGLGAPRMRLIQNANTLQIRYMQDICRRPSEEGCFSPRRVFLGGGIRYDYSGVSYRNEESADRFDRASHRLLLFGEIRRN